MNLTLLLCFIITIAIGLCNGKPKYGARFQTLENNENVDNKQIKLLTQLDDFCDANEQTCQAIQMIVAADLVQLQRYFSILAYFSMLDYFSILPHFPILAFFQFWNIFQKTHFFKFLIFKIAFVFERKQDYDARLEDEISNNA